MHRSGSICLAIVLTAVLAGCSSPKPVTTVDKAQVDAYIRSINKQLDEGNRKRRQMMGDDDTVQYADGTDAATIGVPAIKEATSSE